MKPGDKFKIIDLHKDDVYIKKYKKELVGKIVTATERSKIWDVNPHNDLSGYYWGNFEIDNFKGNSICFHAVILEKV